MVTSSKLTFSNLNILRADIENQKLLMKSVGLFRLTTSFYKQVYICSAHLIQQHLQISIAGELVVHGMGDRPATLNRTRLACFY